MAAFYLLAAKQRLTNFYWLHCKCGVFVLIRVMRSRLGCPKEFLFGWAEGTR